MDICCICGKEFDGYGNNPYPVKDKGCCCDECNANAVIPARIGILQTLDNRNKIVESMV